MNNTVTTRGKHAKHRTNPRYLSVFALHYVNGYPMPAPSGAGRHRAPEGN